jgi:D-psicose/D-tagatose/L-ribulose 3-epimerase
VNPVGCHGSVWASAFHRDGIAHALAMTREAGFDLIEIPLMDPDAIDGAATRRGLAEHELAATASLGLRPDIDVSSPDPEVAARGEAYLQRALAVCADVGATHLGGVIASAMSKYATPPSPAGRAHSAAAIARLGERAAELGIGLSVEVVNRYESNLLNTAEQGLQFLAEVGQSGVSLLLDTYHMNIEEIDHRTPVLATAQRLGYAHAGESHRGYLGTGTVDFDGFFAGLVEVGFAGPVVFESFSSATAGREFAQMLGIWRDLSSDPLDLGRHASAFIRDGLRRAGASRR